MEVENIMRKKGWEEKVREVCNCYHRCHGKPTFAADFYENLFFLNPKIRDYFKKTEWEHQEKALMYGLEHLIHFLENENDRFHRAQVLRIAETHSRKNMNIHPHHYYYWVDALIMTFIKHDDQWYEGLRYYIRECLFFPISFIISLYHKG